MGNKNYEIVEEICNECACTQTFSRSTRKKLTIFFTQENWCFNCKKDTTFFILFDKNYAYNLLCEKKELNEKEKYIKKLLEKNFNNNKIHNKQKNKSN